MPFYWVDFNGRASGTVQADNEAAALERAKAHGTPTRARVLPYAASPVLVADGEAPTFCFQPRQCAGHTACPHRYSCTE